MSEIDTSPEALRNLVIRLNNASRWRGDVLDEAAATVDALAAEKERAAPAPAGDLVEAVAQGIRKPIREDRTATYPELAIAALAAIRAAGKEIVDAGTVERLTRERVAAETRARLAEGDHKAAEQLLAQVRAENARLRELVEDVRDCLDANLTGEEDPDEILFDLLERARAALATKEPGHG
jgi:hypothetical protein